MIALDLTNLILSRKVWRAEDVNVLGRVRTTRTPAVCKTEGPSGPTIKHTVNLNLESARLR